MRNLGLRGRLRGRLPSENLGSAHFSHGALGGPSGGLYACQHALWAVAEYGRGSGEVGSWGEKNNIPGDIFEVEYQVKIMGPPISQMMH